MANADASFVPSLGAKLLNKKCRVHIVYTEQREGITDN